MKATRENQPTRVGVPSGATLEERCDRDGRTSVTLRAPDGGLLLEYLPADGTCRIHAQRIDIEAEQSLRLAGRRVQIEAERGVVLRSGDTTVAVRPDQIGLLTEELRASATSTEWTSKTFRLAAEQVETEAHRIVQRVGELETHARQIIERTRESFREAEELAQTQAGRIRLVAKDTLWALGRRALIKAREDLKLRGDKIYLD